MSEDSNEITREELMKIIHDGDGEEGGIDRSIDWKNFIWLIGNTHKGERLFEILRDDKAYIVWAADMDAHIKEAKLCKKMAKLALQNEEEDIEIMKRKIEEQKVVKRGKIIRFCKLLASGVFEKSGVKIEDDERYKRLIIAKKFAKLNELWFVGVLFKKEKSNIKADYEWLTLKVEDVKNVVNNLTDDQISILFDDADIKMAEEQLIINFLQLQKDGQGSLVDKNNIEIFKIPSVQALKEEQQQIMIAEAHRVSKLIKAEKAGAEVAQGLHDEYKAFVDRWLHA